MIFPRSSGILLHPTSLPSRWGVGDLGPAAYRFADFLAGAGQKLWQVLPLHPTGYGDSPYQCFSAFAGNPLLISLDRLVEDGAIQPSELPEPPRFPDREVDFAQVIPFKLAALRRAAQSFLARSGEEPTTRETKHQGTPELSHNAFDAFCAENSSWLDDFALFMAAKDAHGLRAWTEWDPALGQRKAEALRAWRERSAGDIAIHRVWQFWFFQQWRALTAYCAGRNIKLFGDLPIYVAHDSADVWVNQQLFQLDERGRATVIAGVPPDYFSATGQLWGNPIYRWDVLRARGYDWWIERMRAALRLYGMVRLDHFRGFEAYWEVPGGDRTAERGRWVKGPGGEVFAALESALGELPIVAENLGVITPEVEAIRRRFGFPGMAILQFAFGTDPQGPSFRPHNYARELVAYTGTHDNDTTVGWWDSGVGAGSTRSHEDVEREHAFARAYLGFDSEDINWVLIRSVLRSVANTVVIPLQDVLGIGAEGRMNLPGTTGGNWRWRFTADALTTALEQRLRELTKLYER